MRNPRFMGGGWCGGSFAALCPSHPHPTPGASPALDDSARLAHTSKIRKAAEPSLPYPPNRSANVGGSMVGTRTTRILLFVAILALAAPFCFAQTTGSISGKVTSSGQALPGVTVEARSPVLPQPRVTVTDSNGEYRFPALVPGNYTVEFSLAGMQTVTRTAQVILSLNTVADANLGVQGVAESITVTAEVSLVDKTSASISTGLSSEEIQALPITQEYKDLQKLI